jgi:protein ImuB
VVAADALARQGGARIGMPAQAAALVPGLRLQDADPQADHAALERLALWALGRYARTRERHRSEAELDLH